MSVRALQEGDRPWVAGVYSANKHLSGAFYWSWQEYWKRPRSPQHQFLILEVDGQRAGLVNFKFSKKYDAWYVKEIAVATEFKRRGLGRELMAAVPLPVILKTDEDNPESNAFYKKLGFTMLGKEPSKKGKPMNIYGRWP